MRDQIPTFIKSGVRIIRNEEDEERSLGSALSGSRSGSERDDEWPERVNDFISLVKSF